MGESTRQLARDARRVLREGPEGIARRQRTRLAEQVAYARTNSPYYRELYQELPDDVDDPTLLPVTNKKLLMARFDDWVTDREVSQEKVEAFVADLDLVGHRFQGRYLVATTSGTSGLRGQYVLDGWTTAVHAALGSRGRGDLGVRDAIRMVAGGARTAVVTAPRGHFFGVASSERYRLESRLVARIMRVFSINQPLPDLVEELNRYKPVSLVGYLGMLTQLAAEQNAGRLHIHPAMVVPGGETSTEDDRARLAAAFNAKVRAAYMATECSFLSFGRAHGWYHLNSDWAVVEPVDADHQPVPPGEWSHTVLISNLANQVQPFLRYDLGDSILQRPDPCPCGNPLPAIRVQGRAADLLTFPTSNGEHVSISPMAFGTMVDRSPGVEQFQIVQTAPTTLSVRLRSADGADADRVWQTVHGEITHLLTEQKVAGITLERADEPPRREPSGKFRRVVPLTKP